MQDEIFKLNKAAYGRRFIAVFKNIYYFVIPSEALFVPTRDLSFSEKTKKIPRRVSRFVGMTNIGDNS